MKFTVHIPVGEIAPGEFQSIAAIGEMAGGLEAAGVEACYVTDHPAPSKALLDTGRTTVHHSHTPDITFESPVKAKGIWGVEDYIFDSDTGDLLIHGFGFYHETYEKRGGKWLFTSRKLKRTLVREMPEAAFQRKS